MARVRSPLAVVAATVFLDFVGLTLVIPLLPLWAEHLEIGPRLLGVIAAGYALSQLAFAPLLGALSDRYGRRPVIAVSLLVEAAGFALTAVAGSWAVLLAARVHAGLFGPHPSRKFWPHGLLICRCLDGCFGLLWPR